MLSPDLIATIESLPESLQTEILHYAEFLAAKHARSVSTPPTTTPKKYRQAGSMQGAFILADDFDAPLEDLKDYM